MAKKHKRKARRKKSFLALASSSPSASSSSTRSSSTYPPASSCTPSSPIADISAQDPCNASAKDACGARKPTQNSVQAQATQADQKRQKSIISRKRGGLVTRPVLDIKRQKKCGHKIASAPCAASAYPPRFDMNKVEGVLQQTKQPKKQKLKGKRPTASVPRVLDASHPLFKAVMRQSYGEFRREPAAKLPSRLHTDYKQAFDSLFANGYFQHDIIYNTPNSPGVKTAVTRTLVGEPGITYKYLGIRIFAHPWEAGGYASSDDDVPETDVDDNTAAMPSTASSHSSATISETLHSLKQLNDQLTRRADALLDKDIQTGQGGDDVGVCSTSSGKIRGSAKFSLILINRMVPIQSQPNRLAGSKSKVKIRRKQGREGEGVVTLKKDPLYRLGRLSVSWHADSSLAHHSTIAVYHCWGDSVGDSGDAEDDDEDTQRSWRIALRVLRDVEGPHIVGAKERLSRPELIDGTTPAVSVKLGNGDAYFLLRDFNHHHQHAVLAGDECVRYSSTHRVTPRLGNTVQPLLRQCRRIRSRIESSKGGKDVWCQDEALLNEIQQLSDTVEFEWIRQFYAQGKTHYCLHRWWHGPMQKLCSDHACLRQYTIRALRYLGLLPPSLVSSAGTQASEHGLDKDQWLSLARLLLTALTTRKAQRRIWAKRESGQNVFRSMPTDTRPIPAPLSLSSPSLSCMLLAARRRVAAAVEIV